MRVGLDTQVRCDGEPLVDQWVADVDGLGCHRTIQCVLMEHVARDREQVRFGAADLAVSIDAQQTKEDFLGEVGDVSRVSQARG